MFEMNLEALNDILTLCYSRKGALRMGRATLK